MILDRTPFYAEGGGQVGDTGVIRSEGAELKVLDTKKHDGVYMHICEIVSGTLKIGDAVCASVDADRRAAIRRNHSSVHMLQAALRARLGNHVEQAGSYVDENRARFDFSHYAALTPEELADVEAAVNAEILKGDPIETIETDIESARKMGAMALFGEKYGNIVRVVKMGDYSTELCGGTHLDNTAKAGLFKIISETSVAAGVRRIEATTGLGVLELMREKDQLIADAAREMKIPNPGAIANRAAALQNELKAAKREIEALNAKIAANEASELTKDAVDVDGLTVIARATKGVETDVARTMCDNAKAENDNVVIVLATQNGEKLNFVVACGKEAVARGAHAGNIARTVSQMCGGNGGGRPDSAASGAKDASKIADAIAAVPEIVKSMLK